MEEGGSQEWGAGTVGEMDGALGWNAGENSCALIMLDTPVRFKPAHFTV